MPRCLPLDLITTLSMYAHIDICIHTYIHEGTRSRKAAYARASASSYCADSHLVDAENRYERFVNYARQWNISGGDPILLLAASHQTLMILSPIKRPQKTRSCCTNRSGRTEQID